MEAKFSSEALIEGVVRRLDDDSQKGTQKACRELENTWIWFSILPLQQH